MNPVALLAVVCGVAALLLLTRGRRPSDHGEPGEDIGKAAETATVASPESVELGSEIPDRPPPKEWRDMSKRRRLPVTAYRPAPDERATEPKEARQ